MVDGAMLSSAGLRLGPGRVAETLRTWVKAQADMHGARPMGKRHRAARIPARAAWDLSNTQRSLARYGKNGRKLRHAQPTTRLTDARDIREHRLNESCIRGEDVKTRLCEEEVQDLTDRVFLLSVAFKKRSNDLSPVSLSGAWAYCSDGARPGQLLSPT
jgi:hypothetical protein